MAGYRRKRKQLRLSFTGQPDLEGLEVVVRSLPLGEYLELTGRGDTPRDGDGVRELFQSFATNLVSWNLQEEDGTPVPATREAVYAEDNDLMLTVASQWMDAMAGLVKGDPLRESSPSGGPSLEASIPMAELSQSLAS